MSRIKPNIITPFNDKQRFKDLVNEVINDTWIYGETPDFISLNGNLFTLVLLDRKFVFEEIRVDISSDYVDIFLQGLKISASTYYIGEVGNDIVVTFIENITLTPQEIIREDFSVAGKFINLQYITEDDLFLITENEVDLIL